MLQSDCLLRILEVIVPKRDAFFVAPSVMSQEDAKCSHVPS